MRTTKRLASQRDKPKTFEIVGIGIGITAFKNELIDLSTINIADAERLVKKGFPHIVIKP